MVVVTGTMFLLGLSSLILFFKNDVFTFMGNSFVNSFYNFQNIYNKINLKKIFREKIFTSMISIKEIDQKEFELCYELDSATICLWTKKQWQSEFNKSGTKVVAILLKKKIIGIYVVQTIIDEAQISYFSIKQKFRRKGYGSQLMTYLIKDCEKLNIKKLLLEVSETNSIAEIFYCKFNFLTVGRRKNYYKSGADAVLKEKKFT
jgi:ribosomal-protein-alanine N-acetyltransferase